MDANQDKGGRQLAKKKWRLYYFVVEVAVESPGDLDEAEAEEDAGEFAATFSRTMGRVHDSFCSITRVDEFGSRMPKGGGIVIKREYPTGEQAEVTLPRGIAKNGNYSKIMKKPKKAKSKSKKKARY